MTTSSTPQQPPEDELYRWDTDEKPTDPRKAQLLARLNNFRPSVSQDTGATAVGPFAGQKLTGGEIYWLAAYLLAEDVKAAGPADTHDQSLTTAFERLRKTDSRQKDHEPLLRVSLNFSKLNLNGAALSGAHLAGAVLGKAQLIGAVLGAAHLEGAYLGGAILRDAFLDRADLAKATLAGAQLQGASMWEVNLSGAELGEANLNDAIIRYGDLTGARLIGACLHDVDLRGAQLQSANFIKADLTNAYLYEAHLEGTLFTDATLIDCDLRRTTMSQESRLNNAKLNHASLEQAYLQDTNLAVADWRPVRRWSLKHWRETVRGVSRLGDEIEANESQKRSYSYSSRKHNVGAKDEYVSATRTREYRVNHKTRRQRVDDYRAAERAYRALSSRLDEQGVARDAARFQFRAELMARNANFFQGFWISALVSLVLGWFAGYGIHQIWRLFVTYVAIVLGFTFYYLGYGYYLQGQAISWGAFFSALLLSVTTLHGRGFAMQKATTDVVFAGIATIEAVLGVVVEALLVAALVRRITGD